MIVTMTFHEFIVSIVRARSALLVAGLLGLCGCAVVGPQSITAGRGVYTEVINRTEDEQILNVLVRQRYDETFGMISVASITANLQFSARAATNIGIGDSDNYAGNLVPLAAGVGYEENPTISYIPLSGEDFTRRMLSPVSTGEWLLLGSGARHPGRVFALAVRRVNGLRNPLLEEEPPSPGFVRFVELYDGLRRAGVLDIVQVAGSGNKGNYSWDIHDYQQRHGDSVRELFDLIGIEVKLDGSAILLPLREAVGSSVSAVHVQLRSAYDVLRVFGAGVEVPPPHLEAGIVEPLTSALPEESRVITIRSAEERPENATVRIRFRDWWFYIDATDTRSKRAFLFLQTFIGMRLADPGAAQKAPVITVPVK
jgi:hypothetical protein